MLCAGWELVCVGGDNMYDDIQAGQTILILISLICFYFTTFCVLLEHFTVSIKNYYLGSNHKDFNTEDRPKLISQKSSWFIIPYDWGLFLNSPLECMVGDAIKCLLHDCPRFTVCVGLLHLCTSFMSADCFTAPL